MSDLIWRIPIIVLLVFASGMFSGLTLGLLGLDNAHLQVLIEQQITDEESRKQSFNASKIAPLRKKGNLLLCTLLIGNVAVNAALSIILADFTDGTIGFLLSTILIVVFGEIAPQALCSRYGLVVGAKVRHIVKLLIVVEYIIAKPISAVLDLILGEDPGTKFTKTQMKALFSIYEREERIDLRQKVILSAALDFAEKRVKEIMRPLSETFMIDSKQKFTVELIKEIYMRGFSRIPVYEGEKENIIGILLSKDLMFVNQEKLSKLWRLKQMFLRPAVTVNSSEKLQDVLQSFKKGYSHIAIVQDVVSEGKTDPYYVPVGIVTLEDVLEALIQEDIQDEHDVSRLRTKNKNIEQRNCMYLFSSYYVSEVLSAEELQAVRSFLSVNIEPFKANCISRKRLKKLLRKSKLIVLNGNEDYSVGVEQVVLRKDNSELEESRTSQSEDSDDDEVPSREIYLKGKESQHFHIVLSGSLDLEVGEEKLVTEYGPYRCLGMSCLLNFNQPYIPDFSAYVNRNLHLEPTKLLRISKNHYKKYARI